MFQENAKHPIPVKTYIPQTAYKIYRNCITLNVHIFCDNFKGFGKIHTITLILINKNQDKLSTKKTQFESKQ